MRARCVHGSMLLEYAPSFYPIEQPPQNHTQSPNFCTLQPLLASQEFLFFCSDACHRSQGPNFCTLQLLLVYQD